ncbi:MAG: lectin like domain-containing protein [Ruminococcus sp.]
MKTKGFISLFTAFAAFCSAFTYLGTENTYASERDIPSDFGGYIHMPYEREAHESGTSDSTNAVYQAANLPSSYDLRDENCVTPVRNQGAEGMCHAFSAIGSCESNILKQGLEDDPENLDLSEAQLGYFLYTKQSDPMDPHYGDYLNTPGKGADGGNGLLAAAGLADGLGMEREEFCSYGDWSAGYSEYQRYTGQYRLKTCECITRATDSASQAKIKRWLMESGGVGMAFYSNRSLYYDNGTSYSYYAKNKSFYENANHAALIVGWDDNYSRENFSKDSRPSNDGAWLVKNSYGPDLFDDGYFWISYEDPSLGSFCRYIVEKVSDHDDVYSSSGAGYITAYSFSAAANVFTAEYDCTITDAAFYMPAGNPDNTSYKILVYRLENNTDDPTDGECIGSASGSVPESGYYTVPLEKTAKLLKGQQFSLVLSMSTTDKNKTVFLPVEETTAITSSFTLECEARPGESYVLNQGIWEDTSANEGEHGTLGNIPLKALAVRDEEYAPLKLEAALEAADRLTVKNNLIKDAVDLGNEVLGSGAGADSCSRAANTVLAALEKCGADIQFPDYLYADLGRIKGDSNGDGSITISDAAAVLQTYALRSAGKTCRLTMAEKYAMNAVYDESINIADAAEILSIYASASAGNAD